MISEMRDLIQQPLLAVIKAHTTPMPTLPRERKRKKEIYRQKERETDIKRFTNLIGWENRDGNTGKPRGQMTSGDKSTFTNGFDLFDSVVNILVYVLIKERERTEFFSSNIPEH